ncbi:MAG: D-aminoacyl-tRNA deacylase [Leptonema sp. (in: bacteria)]
MKIVLQRTLNAKVIVEEKIIGEIQRGILLFVGFCKEDQTKTFNDYQKIIQKILLLRIFEDENQKMNYSVIDKQYQILIVSQFTLCADPYKGNRPSFTDALGIKIAEDEFLKFVKLFKQEFQRLFEQKYTSNCNADNFIQQGQFRADMKVHLINDGPVTFYLEF